jgi:hypothetical protein
MTPGVILGRQVGREGRGGCELNVLISSDKFILKPVRLMMK